MVFKKISPKTQAMVQILKEEGKLTVKQIMEKCGVSRATVFRIVKPQKQKVTSKLPGRPRVLGARYERRIKTAIHKLRRTEGNFSAKRVMTEVGLNKGQMTVKTMQNTLRRMGYGYVQARKKGILSAKDIRKRLKFARKVKKDYRSDLWTRKICFYLDGVSFYHKYNPLDQARAPKARIWRKKSEGLDPYCTAKGSHEGSGGRVVKYFVAVSYQKGVVLCEEYEHLDGEFFKSFVLQHFLTTFSKCGKRGRMFLQDGDPSQNCALAKKALASLRAKIFTIPARSPDLNPIENLFHIAKEMLRKEALEKEISHETMPEFSSRIRSTFMNMDVEVIDKILLSMNKRIKKIIVNKGKRIKY